MLPYILQIVTAIVNPQIIRDFRVVQITLNPVQYVAETQELKIQKQMESLK